MASLDLREFCPRLLQSLNGNVSVVLQFTISHFEEHWYQISFYLFMIALEFLSSNSKFLTT
uniref:Uncharacterized protein n=1 Tax=Nelumbo nucifera TaxID=4432 RepID=A0A822XLV5_NELNU|nr:TPA_asm: hypothetical protein HUJ06_022813 [Nelumbo nucifera]